MKRVITLNHHMDGYNDIMFNTSIKYGILYDEIETENGNIMLFNIRENLEDRRTFEYFQDVLCCIFETEPSNYFYDISSISYDVSIYMILLAFIDYMRNHSNERHYKEKIKRFNDARNVDMIESMPMIHLLSNGNYSLMPTECYISGYDVMERLAPEQLKDNTQI